MRTVRVHASEIKDIVERVARGKLGLLFTSPVGIRGCITVDFPDENPNPRQLDLLRYEEPASPDAGMIPPRRAS